MSFPVAEHHAMLALKGVGPSVIQRLEQLGFHSLQPLAAADSADICRQIAGMLRASCWQNSPQARASIDAIIQLARQRHAPS